jgi:hypothetical protein
MCRPNARTKSFAVVDEGWRVLKLDSDGNAKASDLVRNRKSVWGVKVTGEKTKDVITVESISPAS